MTDLLGTAVTPQEATILEVYRQLKELVADPDLSPSVVANLREALASTSIVVVGLALEDERLIDLGC